MTIIAEDTDISDRTREVGRRAEDSTRRIVAAIAGALEGIAEALDEYDLAEEGKRATHEAGEISRAVAGEAQTQARTPEMQQLGEQLRTAGTATADYTGEKVDTLRTSIHDARVAAGERYDDVKHAAQRAKEGAKVRVEAVAESGRRARVAPGRIRRELMAAYDAWKKGLVTALLMFGVIAVVAIVALVVLTIALVVGFNALIGDPAGTFLVAGIYVLAGLVAYGVMRGARTRAANETEERMSNAREEARRVVRPVRRAFGGRTI